MATLTTTVSQTRPRRFSLSLVSARPSPLLKLPAELVLDILELSLSETKPSTLAIISKVISCFVDIILYRTVVLHSKESITLFHRTTLSRPVSFFASHVKKLVVSYKPQNLINFQRAQQAISVCGGARSLVLSMWFGMDCLASIMQGRADGGVSEVILHSPDGMAMESLRKNLPLDTHSDSVTHLRVCEPGEGWTAPDDILRSFGTLRGLTHLQLARRINSNVDNDRKFEEQVRTILQTRPTLAILAVVIYPQPWAPEEDVSESDIWGTMREVAEQDSRVVLSQGKIEDWGKSGQSDRDFWMRAVSEISKVT